MNGPIERVKPANGSLAAQAWGDQIAAHAAAQPAAVPAEPIIGASDAPQDSFELRDPETEFPTLEVITQRILNAMHEALKQAADAAERKAETHANIPLEQHPATEPEKNGRIDRPENAADRTVARAANPAAVRESGTKLLGEAKVALSQSSRCDLVAVHSVQGPFRFFTRE